MEYRHAQNQWVVRLDKGEVIVDTLHHFFQQQHLTGGYVWGIGSVTNVVLGYYDVQKKEYLRKTFDEVYELLSLQGNITVVDNAPFLHAHVLLSGKDFAAFGGHLFEATVRATVELAIVPWPFNIGRQFHTDVGLKLWKFDATI